MKETFNPSAKPRSTICKFFNQHVKFNVVQSKEKYVIPDYLRLPMSSAVKSRQLLVAGDVIIDKGLATIEYVPCCPIIVLISPNSGSHKGSKTYSILTSILTEDQVYDLSQVEPYDVFHYGIGYLDRIAESGNKCAMEVREKLRIVVGGGDGTVARVLQSLLQYNILSDAPLPPVAILPLGTGNDLARTFGWGGKFGFISQYTLQKYLIKVEKSLPIELDSWKIDLKMEQGFKVKLPHGFGPIHETSIVEDGKSNGDIVTSSGFFFNYLSMGMDAEVAYAFDRFRKRAPQIIRTANIGKIVYGGLSCLQGWFCTCSSCTTNTLSLSKSIRLYIKSNMSDTWELVEIPPSIRALVILNIQSYAGGINLWGHPKEEENTKMGFVVPRPNDGLLEIVGLDDGWHVLKIMLKVSSGIRIAQASAIKLELYDRKVYMQMDGEPWEQPLNHKGKLTSFEITHVFKQNR